jgi:vacuolar-type H+-ATPase subunit I/STV1
VNQGWRHLSNPNDRIQELNRVKSRKLTLRKEVLLGFGLIITLAAAVGFIGHRQMRTVARKAEFSRQIHRCESQLQALSQVELKLTASPDQLDPAAGQVSNDWKKAKDKFLAEVKKLSQTQTLDENEKALIDAIRNAWQGYEVSFTRRTMALLETSLSRADEMAQASLQQTIARADRGLIFAIILATLVGSGIVLIIARDVRRRLKQVHNQLEIATQPKREEARSEEAGQDELKTQAEELKNALAELAVLIGQAVVQDIRTADESIRDESGNEV